MSGVFLSLDGIDGCGKSTQISLLEQHFAQRGTAVLVVRDPGGTQLGESLRDLLLHNKEIQFDMRAEMLLYMASRAQLVSEVVRPALESGKTVIADRYLLANVAYQAATGQIPPKDIWQVGGVATAGLTPAMTILLDLPVETAMKRLQADKDRMESRGSAYMHSVREQFLAQAEQLGDRIQIIDASRSVTDIHAEILEIIRQLRF